MTRDVIFARVVAIVRDVLDQPDVVVTADTVARDVPGWDSIAMVNIILAVQDAFAIRFRTADVDNLLNVGAFVDRVEAKTAGR